MAKSGDDPPRGTSDGALRDGIIGAVVIAVASVVATVFDLTGLWVDFARKYRGFGLEELPIFLAILAVVLAWYSFRRWREATLTSAIRRRLNTHLEILLSRENLRIRQLTEIKAMDERLLAAEDSRQACEIAVSHLRRIFPFGSGAFFVVRKGLATLTPIGGWGAFGDEAPGEIETICCQAVITGMSHEERSNGEAICDGCGRPGADGVICLPVAGQGKTFGVLHMRYGGVYGDLPGALNNRLEFDNLLRLAGEVGRGIGQHLANVGLRRQLYDESWRDPLTNLLNRRGLQKVASHEMARVAEEGETMAVMMMDLDEFKSINDRLGHDVGDAILEFIGQAIQNQCRAGDILCRLGGDEFLVALPSAGIEIARRRGEALRAVVADLGPLRDRFPELTVTLSVGIAVSPKDGTGWDEIVAAADAALYQAKRAGRDRIAAKSDPLEPLL